MIKPAKIAVPLFNRKPRYEGANQTVYVCDPPLDGHRYVVVSAVEVAGSGAETYIFPSNQDGKIVSWTELTGSQRGTLSHEKALKSAGYTSYPLPKKGV